MSSNLAGSANHSNDLAVGLPLASISGEAGGEISRRRTRPSYRCKSLLASILCAPLPCRHAAVCMNTYAVSCRASGTRSGSRRKGRPHACPFSRILGRSVEKASITTSSVEAGYSCGTAETMSSKKRWRRRIGGAFTRTTACRRGSGGQVSENSQERLGPSTEAQCADGSRHNTGCRRGPAAARRGLDIRSDRG